ncbi:hypothetical protein CRE_26101 [Caenorhabditis remanei]|uniref:CYRIA/CYRIB Rac1 binding domain-containing protein n=1 Tax=Caenorhabditis remanei TaxID=31234 RepID=E3LRQ5_CAERE|nr:hypothetical protein CRE_26101 [Caenorhabditis remanei]
MPSNIRESDASCLEMIRSIIRSTADDNSKWVEIFVDFENAQPTNEEREIYNMAEEVLHDCDVVLADVSSYGNGCYIERSQLKNDSDTQALKILMTKLEPFVARTCSYYEHVAKIEKIVPILLWELSSGPLPLEEQLANKQSIAKQFARLIGFVLDFDVVKMKTAQITNDYSYYRRAKHIVYQDFEDQGVPELPQVQMFLCEGNPMLKALCNGVDSYMHTHQSLPINNTTDVFVTIINVCRFMLANEDCLARLTDSSKHLCCRVMTGLVILFDHVDQNGAFVSNSSIDMRDVVRLIKSNTTQEQSDCLLAGLRFTTKHYNDSSTPKSLRHLIEVK